MQAGTSPRFLSWLSWLTVLVLLWLLGRFAWVTVERSFQADLDGLKRTARQQLDVSGWVISTRLQEGRHRDIQPYLDQLAAANPAIARIDVTAAGGARLGGIERSTPVDHDLMLTAPISYGAHGRAALRMQVDLGEAYRRRQALGSQAGLALGGLALLLIGLVHLATKRREEELRLTWRTAELEAARNAILASEARLRTVIETEPECIEEIDADGRLRELNPAGLTLFEADRLETVSRKPRIDYILPEHQAAFSDLLAHVLAGGSGRLDFEMEGLFGGRRWVEMNAAPFRESDGRISAMIAVTRDISARRRAEHELKDLNRTHTVLQRCNEVLVRATAEDQLLTDMCAILVERGGYVLSWIGFARNDEQCSVRVAAARGATSYVDGLRLSWAENAPGSGGPVGRAIRSGQSVLVRDVAADPGFTAWRESAARHGIGSVIVLPLGSATPAMGALCIYSAQVDRFIEQELGLLTGLANDIAYGIQSLRAEGALHESNQRLQQITENIREGFWMTDLGSRRLLYASAAYRGIWQRSPEELARAPHQMLESIHPDDRDRVVRAAAEKQILGTYDEEYRVLRPDGSEVWVRDRAFPIHDTQGHVYRIAGTSEDITEQKRNEARLEFHRHHDTLTGLANRELLSVQMEQAMAFAQRQSRLVAVAMIDLDRFKTVNELYDLRVADELLRQVALRLRGRSRATDTPARLGGDQFVLILSDQSSVLDSLQVMREIKEELSRPYRIAEHAIPMTCSIGVAFYPNDGQDVGTLMRCADAAMARAKQQKLQQGRDSIQAFSAEMNQRINERVKLETNLQQALENQQFVLAYQAKVDARSGRIVGVEALIRWDHPQLGRIAPDRFIPIAEDTGVIHRIGEWVIRTACQQMRDWQAATGVRIPVSVNLSPRQFNQSSLCATIEAALEQSGLQPRFLDLEVTENLLVADTAESTRTLKALRALGVQLSIDDFGIGNSNLEYLIRFLPNRLKIDRKFVAGLPDDTRNGTIATSIITLAHQLGIEVVGEGVETPEQLEFLCARECDEVQGFLFSMPVMAEAFGELLRRGRLPALEVARA